MKGIGESEVCEGKKMETIISVLQVFGYMLCRSSTLVATTGAASEITTKKSRYGTHLYMDFGILTDEARLIELAVTTVREKNGQRVHRGIPTIELGTSSGSDRQVDLRTP